MRPWCFKSATKAPTKPTTHFRRAETQAYAQCRVSAGRITLIVRRGVRERVKRAIGASGRIAGTVMRRWYIQEKQKSEREREVGQGSRGEAGKENTSH